MSSIFLAWLASTLKWLSQQMIGKLLLYVWAIYNFSNLVYRKQYSQYKELIPGLKICLVFKIVSLENTTLEITTSFLIKCCQRWINFNSVKFGLHSLLLLQIAQITEIIVFRKKQRNFRWGSWILMNFVQRSWTNRDYIANKYERSSIKTIDGVLNPTFQVACIEHFL